mgnify:CR=1 FL=1
MRIKDPVDELSAQGFIEGHIGEGSWQTRSERYRVLSGTPAETQPAKYWIVLVDEKPVSSFGMMDFGDWYVTAGGWSDPKESSKGYFSHIAKHVMELHTDKPIMSPLKSSRLHRLFGALGFTEINEVPENASGSIKEIIEKSLTGKIPVFVRQSGRIEKSFDYIWEFTIKKGGY